MYNGDTHTLTHNFTRLGKSVLYDQPTHVGRESVDKWPAISRLSVGR